MKAAISIGLALLLAAAAAPAADDSLLFVRDGRVMLLPAGSDQPRSVIAPDPGWVYDVPTWIDQNQFVTMRLKGGEAGRSHVGIVTIGPQPVAPARIDWINLAGGSWTIGVSPDGHTLGMLKIQRLREEQFDVYLSLAPLFSEGSASHRIAHYQIGDPMSPGKRLRWTPDGKMITAPVFPTDVSNTVGTYNLSTFQPVTFNFLDYDWQSYRKMSPDVSCIAFGSGSLVACGTATSGLWLCHPIHETAQALDPMPDAQAGVREVCFGRDLRTLYYEVQPFTAGNPKPEIRTTSIANDAKPRVLLANASCPDALPKR